MRSHRAMVFGLWFWAAAVLAQNAPTASTNAANKPALPPAEARILKIIHGWPDAAEAQDQLIQRLARQGFGGVVCNVSFADYLESEPRWRALARAVEASQKAGFALWLYDEKGYPSGTAGGLVLRGHPEWEAEGLLIADTEGEGRLEVKLPPGAPFLIAGFPVRDDQIDLNAVTNLAAQAREGKLSWAAPPGRWRVLAITRDRLFEGTHADMSLSKHIPYPNLLQPEPIARFLELTHDRYAQRLGGDLGRHFVATFTDEPSLMSLFLRPMPYRVLPWSPNLPAAFQRRWGRALEPLVPALVAEAGPAGHRARYQYWRTVGDLVADSFFGQIQRWCAAHNILSGGHLLMEENLVGQVPLYGDFFGCLRRLDAPSIDCLTSLPDQAPWWIARLAASAAELEDKSLVMSETSDHSQRYRPPGDQRPAQSVSEAQIRGTCNRLMVSGVNRITSYYSFAGLADDSIRRLNLWVGRCCAALTGGRQVTDLAVVYPVESVWPRFTPARHYANDSPAAARLESLCRDAAESLYAAGRDFTFIDSRALAEAKVESGRLVHRRLRWRVVILPGVDTLPLAAWERLAEFVRAGGVVLALGALPANSEHEFPDARVQTIAREIFGAAAGEPGVRSHAGGGAGIYLPAGTAGLLPFALAQIVEPGFEALAGPGTLRATHRRIDGKDVYFVINDSPEPWQGQVRVAARGAGAQENPADGHVRAVPAGGELTLDLPAYGATILRFSDASSPARRQVPTGVLPNLALTDLPEASPTIGRGEYVREELQSATLGSGAPRPAWRFKARLTRSGVDTYLFACFRYPAGVDLRDADGLVLNTAIPEDQRTSSRLLVVLHEKTGADYFAGTGRWLGTPGREQVYLPLSRFQLAGWSKDDNGRLDLDNVTEVRIGWGGYFGTEGESIEFTLAQPQSARCNNAQGKLP